MSEELKPCPFCGGEAEITKWHEGYFVECREQSCGGTIGAYKTEEETIEAWNTRAERTCRNITRHRYYGFECSECKWSAYEPNDYGNDVNFDDFNYCPSCGAKVVE